MNEYTQLNGRIRKPKAEKFKLLVRKSGKKQEFSLEEAIDMWIEKNIGV